MGLASVPLRAVDDSRASSISHRLRARRFEEFDRFACHGSGLRILDVGGTVAYWEQRGWTGRSDVELTLLNLVAEPSEHANVTSLAGDARALPFDDNSFDIAFSNSVIEHVGDHADQKRMADEIRRVAARYWVQTPNYWFPLEPHYLVPGWQWLPTQLRVAILRRRTVGQLGRTPDPVEARAVVEHTRLLTRRQLQRMFPDGELRAEKFAGLVKSWTIAR
jgi:Methyltransferase domain